MFKTCWCSSASVSSRLFIFQLKLNVIFGKDHLEIDDVNRQAHGLSRLLDNRSKNLSKYFIWK